MRRTAWKATLAAAAVIAGGVLHAPGGHALAAGALSCGSTVTTSVRLTADLGPCLGDGLVVRAAGITVDLGGHTITGGDRGAGTTPEQVGVRVVNVSGVTVRHGTVRNFYAGIVLHGGSADTVTGITAVHNLGTGTQANTLGDGIYLDGSSNDLVTANTVSGNGPYGGIELWNQSLNNVVSFNRITDNNIPDTAPDGPPGQLDDGIHTEIGSSYTTVEGNIVERNGHHGIAVDGHAVTGAIVRDNFVSGNGLAGIDAGGNGGHLVTHNVVLDNGYDQFELPGTNPNPDSGINMCGTCLDNLDTPDTVVEDNVVMRNAYDGITTIFNGYQILGGTGIYGTIPPVPYTPPRSNLIQRNVVRDNVHDGIYIQCDYAYDADFNATCMSQTPQHAGMRILDNVTGGNGAGSGGTAWDLHDENPGCGWDVFHGNTYKTAAPPCAGAA